MPAARRPRPVADVPPAALADGEAPAKGWLLALLAARPLREAPDVPTTDFAAHAPALCATVLRAVGSDGALAELEEVAPRAGTLAGADDAASVVAAIGHLRAALWEVLTSALAPLDTPTTVALAERLAVVCDAVAVAALGGGVRVHDARGDWRAAVERHVGAARPFALVAIEVDDAERLRAAGAGDALAAVEDAIRRELRPRDVLGREQDGRLWVVAADLGASGARALAERLAGAVAAVTPVHGTPLTVSMGAAASPSDGSDVETLSARADEALYAARAAGVPIG